MNDLLIPLSRTPGFRGVGLFNPDGVCLGHTLQPPYDPVICNEIINRFETLTSIASSVDEGPAEWLVLNTDVMFVGLRRMEQATLIVLADPDVNAAMLHVACNSLALKLVKALAATPPSLAASAPTVPSRPSALQSAIAPAAAPSMIGSPSLVGAGVDLGGEVPPDAVGAPMLNHILRVYMRFTGDQAKYLLRDELMKLGVRPQTLRQGQVTDLLDRLGQYIPNRSERRRFRSEALGD